MKDHSVTPPLIKTKTGFENIQVFSLIGSDDVLPESPGFVFGGSADGVGFMKNPDGPGFVAVVNHEDNFAVSRIYFNPALKLMRGEYLLNSDGGILRPCSATLATPEEHGFGPLFLTCGESGRESRTHAINPFEKPASPFVSREVPGLGRLSAENAVPLAADAFAGKTVIIIGGDDSAADGGQVFMYVGNRGDLNNGDFYMLKRKDSNQQERDIVMGQSYEVELVKVENHKSLTGAQISSRVNPLGALKFGRVEDIDYRKGGAANSREIYFNVTGQEASGANADFSRTKYGRVYKMVLNANDPTKGTLQVVLDGDVVNGPANEFQNPDNIAVTNNYAYIQEDSNGYGNVKGTNHDAYIYQYNLATGDLKVVFELDHRRNAPDAGYYNGNGTSSFGSWEYGAMIDISDLIGKPNTFAICIQPHTWRGDKYKGLNGGSLRPNENQASQIVLVRGVPR
jgi:hypothetical protein